MERRAKSGGISHRPEVTRPLRRPPKWTQTAGPVDFLPWGKGRGCLPLSRACRRETPRRLGQAEPDAPGASGKFCAARGRCGEIGRVACDMFVFRLSYFWTLLKMSQFGKQTFQNLGVCRKRLEKQLKKLSGSLKKRLIFFRRGVILQLRGARG